MFITGDLKTRIRDLMLEGRLKYAVLSRAIGMHHGTVGNCCSPKYNANDDKSPALTREKWKLLEAELTKVDSSFVMPDYIDCAIAVSKKRMVDGYTHSRMRERVPEYIGDVLNDAVLKGVSYSHLSAVTGVAVPIVQRLIVDRSAEIPAACAVKLIMWGRRPDRDDTLRRQGVSLWEGCVSRDAVEKITEWLIAHNKSLIYLAKELGIKQALMRKWLLGRAPRLYTRRNKDLANLLKWYREVVLKWVPDDNVDCSKITPEMLANLKKFFESNHEDALRECRHFGNPTLPAIGKWIRKGVPEAWAVSGIVSAKFRKWYYLKFKTEEPVVNGTKDNVYGRSFEKSIAALAEHMLLNSLSVRGLAVEMGIPEIVLTRWLSGVYEKNRGYARHLDTFRKWAGVNWEPARKGSAGRKDLKIDIDYGSLKNAQGEAVGQLDTAELLKPPRFNECKRKLELIMAGNKWNSSDIAVRANVRKNFIDRWLSGMWWKSDRRAYKKLEAFIDRTYKTASAEEAVANRLLNEKPALQRDLPMNEAPAQSPPKMSPFIKADLIGYRIITSEDYAAFIAAMREIAQTKHYTLMGPSAVSNGMWTATWMENDGRGRPRKK